MTSVCCMKTFHLWTSVPSWIRKRNIKMRTSSLITTSSTGCVQQLRTLIITINSMKEPRGEKRGTQTKILRTWSSALKTGSRTPCRKEMNAFQRSHKVYEKTISRRSRWFWISYRVLMPFWNQMLVIIIRVRKTSTQINPSSKANKIALEWRTGHKVQWALERRTTPRFSQQGVKDLQVWTDRSHNNS